MPIFQSSINQLIDFFEMSTSRTAETGREAALCPTASGIAAHGKLRQMTEFVGHSGFSDFART
jgi:hypothetical protein